MSVKMETMLVVRLAGCTHRITIENARDLHSRLSRFIAGASVNGSGDDAPPSREVKRVREIQACTINYFGLDAATFAGRAQYQTYTWPRMIAMAMSREMTALMSLVEIGNEFGRDHGTVLYAVRQVASRLSTYPEKRKDVDAIRAKLNGQNGGAQ